MQLHRDCKEFIDTKNYPSFEAFARKQVFGTDLEKLNCLKTILVLIKNHPYLQYTRNVLTIDYRKLEKKMEHEEAQANK